MLRISVGIADPLPPEDIDGPIRFVVAGARDGTATLVVRTHPDETRAELIAAARRIDRDWRESRKLERRTRQKRKKP